MTDDRSTHKQTKIIKILSFKAVDTIGDYSK